MLTVLEDVVPRMTFGPEGDEVTGDWEKLPNEELIDLYSSPNTIRVINQQKLGGWGM